MPRRKPPLNTSKTSCEQDEYYPHWEDLEAHDEHLNRISNETYSQIIQGVDHTLNRYSGADTAHR
ncbi:hypothetical protein HYDPIDRAFT_44657 [Hydnomerulius pinastri MD-312]|uniref:Uncharacterized protein n=1 Tax=Hydnomerulius pinastri MD-312 TaxID=994086 RepID=A0A0C9VKJ4_9AGAM|nr:hypothetical protein HYDPIDRAFT_44657 [Hydnomerulius pinastri MD-312]